MLHRLLPTVQALFVAGALLPGLAAAQTLTGNLPSPPPPSTTDPRVGLKAGWKDAAVASMSLQLVGHVDRQGSFVDENNVGDFGLMNSDMAFKGNTLFMGNFHGVQIYDISNPMRPRLRGAIECPGGQGDVSVHGNLLFMSVEETRGRVDCGGQGIDGPHQRRPLPRRAHLRHPQPRPAPPGGDGADVPRLAHAHARAGQERPGQRVHLRLGHVRRAPGRRARRLLGGQQTDPNSSYFRIEVIKVPVDAPQQAAIVNSSRFLLGLAKPPEHGPAAADIAAAAQRAAAARAQGKFTVMVQGTEEVLPDQFAQQQLARSSPSAAAPARPRAADSAALARPCRASSPR